MLMADLEFNDIDYELALNYLLIAGGKSHMEDIGLNNVAPRWLGRRQDLLSVGGDCMNEHSKWSKLRRDLSPGEKK